MNDRTILVTGAAGAVADPLCAGMRRKGWHVVGTDCVAGASVDFEIDITASYRSAIKYIKNCKPVAVIHLAANKNVELLEINGQQSYTLNVDTPLRLADDLSHDRIQFIFLSSDYVFRGDTGNYLESSLPDPTTEYGKQKYQVEKGIMANRTNGTIVRSASIFGIRGDFLASVLASLKAGDTYSAFTDLVTTPTFIEDVVEIVDRIIRKSLTGIFHAVGSESVTRFEFAQKIALAYGYSTRAIDAALCGTNRPRCLSLSNQLTCRAVDYFPRSLDQILADLRQCQG